jgi:isoprenylcysteine carboxyl methyltransferase (ICMT) family protein YpbQ
MNTANDLAKAEADYRKARFTIIGHGIFFVACCTLAVIARRMFKMPPALLTVVFVVALLLFGGDLLRFLSTKRRLGRLREAQTR